MATAGERSSFRKQDARSSSIRSADVRLDASLPFRTEIRLGHIPAGAGRHLGRPTQVAGLVSEPLLMAMWILPQLACNTRVLLAEIARRASVHE